jgi:hypothetical protein
VVDGEVARVLRFRERFWNCYFGLDEEIIVGALTGEEVLTTLVYLSLRKGCSK